jgi:hypothetical protein
MTIYKIYTERNWADSWRDPDDIQICELGYKNSLEDALTIAKNYIKESFFHKDTDLRETYDGNYLATDFRSYGATIHVKSIIID